MAFDPDDYLKSKVSSGDFDPDAYLAYKNGGDSSKKETDGAPMAALSHFGNAASFGYMPQLQGIASKIIPDPSKDVDDDLKSKGFKIVQPEESYTDVRDNYIKELKQQEQDHPYASAAGTLGGALTSGIATSGLLPINAATTSGRLLQAGKAGAIIGAVSNPGDTAGQISGLQLGDRGENALVGGATGLATQGAIEQIASGIKGLTNVGSGLKDTAEERAFKSSGAMLKDYRNAYGQDRINALGRYMLDNGLVKPGMGVQDIAEAAEKLNGQHGQAISDILNGLDEAGAAAPSHADMAKEVEKLGVPFQGMKTAQPTYGAIQDVADDIRSMGNGQNPSFKNAQDVKGFISDQIKKVGGWNAPNPSEKNLALRQAYSSINGMIEDAADSAAQASGDQGLLDKYLSAKSGYRNSIDINKIASDKALRNNANNFLSLGDKIGAGAGFVAGASSGGDLEDRFKKGMMGASVGLGAKYLRTYGTPYLSTALDAAGNAISNTPLQKIGQAIEPALDSARKSIIPASVVEGFASRPSLATAPLRAVASQPVSGEDKWAQDGIQKLGIDDDSAKQMVNDPRLKALLIQASDLQPGSKAMKNIKDQLMKGMGTK